MEAVPLLCHVIKYTKLIKTKYLEKSAVLPASFYRFSFQSKALWWHGFHLSLVGWEHACRFEVKVELLCRLFSTRASSYAFFPLVIINVTTPLAICTFFVEGWSCGRTSSLSRSCNSAAILGSLSPTSSEPERHLLGHSCTLSRWEQPGARSASWRPGTQMALSALLTPWQ